MMELIKNLSGLKKLKLSEINMSDNFEPIHQFIVDSQINNILVYIDFSYLGLKSKQMLKISEALIQNKNLSNLNLSGNHLDPKEFEVGDKKEKMTVSDELLFCTNIAMFMRTNKNLLHLNLSDMNLCKGLIIINAGMKQSKSIMCIHLSGNHLDKELKFELSQSVGQKVKE